MTKFRNSKVLGKFGENLRKQRLLKDLSQEALATKANVPVSQIGRIERGEINTTISTACLLAKILDIPYSELFNFK